MSAEGTAALIPHSEASLADVEMRLVRLGFLSPDVGLVGLSDALVAFQSSRGIPETGDCDRITWRSLVEAGFAFGDRVLYLRNPSFRGEDVAWLQERLGNLGFDPGRVDGIFGTRTRDALQDFQSNVALPADGICGGATVDELRRVFGRSTEHIHGVRERQRLRIRTKPLSEASVAILAALPLEQQADLLAQRLRARGAKAVALTDADQSHLATIVNTRELDLVTYFDFSTSGLQVAYYSGFRYTSPAGMLLAQMVADGLSRLELPVMISLRGMTLPILRETRMPAVSIAIDHPHRWLILGPEVVEAVAASIEEFLVNPESGTPGVG
ncbi:MAG: peptidoglycan-binding protein [Ferrimicrobium sp.]|uniref:peptidoglycan-binding protein n=1 Tax=Ferrimicrobium sp. TaxID=2926050 RepID=UPI0026106551|nr:peptidoglycan-binding protein [Ferrimicrobium sp.]